MRHERDDFEEEKLLGHSTEPGIEAHAQYKVTPADEKTSDIETSVRATWQNLPQKKQIFLIALCRLSTPLSNACLIPYLYFLVKSILSDPEHTTASQQISRLTGLLVAAFPIGQMLTSMLWGRLSDTYGRRPAVLVGLAISVVANLAFGFSRTIGVLVFWRIVAGMGNGIVGVLRTMTAEIVKDRKHQPRAFLAPPVVFNTGRVIALAVGGCLADPAENLPHLFGRQGIFNTSNNPSGVLWTLRYPYALPALFNGVVLATCLLVATLWLEESIVQEIPRKAHNTEGRYAIIGFIKAKLLRSAPNNYTLLDHTHSDPGKHEKSSTVRKIWSNSLYKVLAAFALLPLHNAAFLHIFPLLLSMPLVSNQKPNIFFFQGGLGMASPTIGLYLALFGIAGIALQLFLYPRIHQRIGTLGVFRLAHAIFPIAYIFVPYLALLVDHNIAKWIAIAVLLFTQILARTMAIPSSVLLLTDAAPHRRVLGTVHGAGNTLSSLASVCGPAIGGVLLAKGIDIGAVGFVWWVWMCTISTFTLGWSFILDRSALENEAVAAGASV
ncbi:major facilitator superfamily domain-containing protein [Phaeosphaeria sp. MPI-PUGE-AT-0046c]|nr:major facilitator superfamily domain-containing protein [Phaeosphaeria sp. MPI-PUGE-AT-0046c]